MPWRFRDRREDGPGTAGRPGRADRRRRPSLEGLEGRQLLSLAPSPASAAVLSPEAGDGRSNHPVVVRATSLPPLRAWAGQEFEGVVASFISNTAFSPEELTATISWGDGRAGPGSIEPSAWGGFNVRGAHTYESPHQGPSWVRVDVFDARTERWVAGVEQRVFVSRPSPTRVALHAAGFQAPGSRHEPAERAQPVRLRFVERRQQYHEAMDRLAQGTATQDDLRFLKQVKDFKEQQSRNYWQRLGDNFVNSIPFT